MIGDIDSVSEGLAIVAQLLLVILMTLLLIFLLVEVLFLPGTKEIGKEMLELEKRVEAVEYRLQRLGPERPTIADPDPVGQEGKGGRG